MIVNTWAAIGFILCVLALIVATAFFIGRLVTLVTRPADAMRDVADSAAAALCVFFLFRCYVYAPFTWSLSASILSH